jgi:hypothetical protein
MAKRGSITINGGIFLTKKEDLGYDYWDIGYFECDASFPDVKVYVDGDLLSGAILKLGAAGDRIDVKLEKGGSTLETGVQKGRSFPDDVLRREVLYGAQVTLDEGKLDSVLRFHSGHFRPSMVKQRYFKQHDPTGKLAGSSRKDMGAIAHNVVVHYDLSDGDKLTIASKTKTYFQKVIDPNVRDRLELEILADDSTSLKYFCDCVDPATPFFWVPNQGTPPVTLMP